MKFKRTAYLEKHKRFFLVKDLNSEHALGILKQENIDVVLNARTRTFFKKKLLASPRLGCINIHHGLLPDQRGLMCDFWAHLDGTPAGFSIHQMTSKLDDGAILKVVPVVTDQKDYMTSILLASQMEVRAAEESLDAIAAAQAIVGTENLKTENTLYRRNPGIFDFYKLRKKGTRI
jgi:methionyl-tRNA formyltransferase